MNPKGCLRTVVKFCNALVYVALPRLCAACGAPLPYDAGHPLCDDCRAEVRFLDGLVCVTCGVPLPDGGTHCFRCRGNHGRRPAADLMRGAVAYDGPVRNLIHKLKFGGCPHLARQLGAYLVDLYVRVLGMPPIDLMCAVPLARMRRIMRGYNQAELIARAFGDAIGVPVIHILHRSRSTRAQARLSREQRFHNVRGVFELRVPDGAVAGKTVAVVDDVCTTGQTLDQCARVLKAAGAERVYCLSVARDGGVTPAQTGGALDKAPRIM